jgi:hypothetical protein
VKPFLTDKNMSDRVDYALSHVLPSGLFLDMYDTVHIDEKWFYMTKVKNSYYLLKDEEEPHRTCKSKRYIDKVMFMAAVARPGWDERTMTWFDGKIGIWPFVYEEPARCSSKNRPAGSMVLKSTVKIDEGVHRAMMIDNVIPAILSKWPCRRGEHIYVQQDNAPAHTKAVDAEVAELAAVHNVNLEMKRQPSNSPDFNVLDLGFFNAIQTLQHQYAPTSIRELVDAVENAFYHQPRETLDNVFLSLQQAMVGAMSVGGNNSYKLRHMGKEGLRRAGMLPVSIRCDEDVLEGAREAARSTHAQRTVLQRLINYYGVVQVKST